MTVFHLMRHGETRWDLANERGLKGWGNDLVPLSALGVEQIEGAVAALRPITPRLVLSSPMTRALQSAAVASRALDLPLVVDFDLHEWSPDTDFTWDSAKTVTAAYAELRSASRVSVRLAPGGCSGIMK